jgi:trigger factor
MSEVQNTEDLIRQIQVTLDAKDIASETTKQLKQVAAKMKYAGFRPGKVPVSIAERLHGNDVKQEVIERKTQDAFWKIVSEQKLKVAGNIRLDEKEIKTEGDVITCQVRYETFPTVTLPSLSDVSLDRFKTDITEDDVTQTLDNMRQSRATYIETSEVVKSKDRVTIDFIGRLDGQPFEGGTAQGYTFVLGQGGLLPEFELAIEGMKPQEVKNFPLTFPENYGAKNLAGKTVEFEVTLQKTEAPQLPELNDTFAKQFEVENVDLLKQKVRENMEREVKNRIYMKNRDLVFEWLNKNISLTLPEAMVAVDMKHLHQEFLQQMQSKAGDQKKALSQFGHLPPELFRARAQERVQLSLILRHIEEAGDLKVSEQQIDEELSNRASVYDKPDEYITWIKGNAQQMEEVRAVTLEKNLVEWVYTKIKTNEKTIGFKDLLSSGQ